MACSLSFDFAELSNDVVYLKIHSAVRLIVQSSCCNSVSRPEKAPPTAPFTPQDAITIKFLANEKNCSIYSCSSVWMLSFNGQMHLIIDHRRKPHYGNV